MKLNTNKTHSFRFLTLMMLVATITLNCSESNKITDGGDTDLTKKYFVGIEAATDPATDVLSSADSLTGGSISPVNNGFEQPAWMSFIQGEDQIFTMGYTSAPEFTSYALDNGVLVKGESFFTDLAIYAHDIVDESTMVLVGSAREGLSEKKIYLINTDDMVIDQTITVDFGNDEQDSLIAFPTDTKVRGSHMFVSYYMISASGDFSTPKANDARVAVFSYPGLELQKIIIDERAPNIGRYYTFNALEIAENGDIYSFSPSALASGYTPVPATNSGILRIKNGETEFDSNYHMDIEAISGGYKINDFFYVANGKAVARVHKEEESNGEFLWANYAPTSSTPLLETAIIDLNTQTFTLLENVPSGGGGWASAALVEGSKLLLGISNSSYAGIYIIDTETNTATEGATVDGNYAKAILALEPTQ